MGKKDGFRLVFMGTPDFAVPALEKLSKSRHEVSMVVTQPDRPKGRGRKVVPPPVREIAERLGLKVLQPVSVNTSEFTGLVEDAKPDFFVVVAFGQMLGKDLLKVPGIASLNIHPSLLPLYRGPAPIQRAIMGQEKVTGVTIMALDEGMDSGDILMQSSEPLGPEDTAGILHDRLAEKGADLLLKTLDGFAEGTIQRIPQDDSKSTYADSLRKKDGMIQWSQSASEIDALIRGTHPWPGAFTFYNDRRIKIFKVKPAPSSLKSIPGTVIKGFDDELRVATGRGALSIVKVQASSGKTMDIKDFLRGNKIPVGSVLGKD